MVLTPQQLEHLDAFSQTYTRAHGKLNIRFSQIYHYQRNITSKNGKRKGRPEDG
jgi:hypothetical protein